MAGSRSQEEVRLHLTLAAAGLASLQSHPLLRALTQGQPRSRSLACAYFDTREGDLARLGMRLRLRASRSGFAQSLEADAEGRDDPFARRTGESLLPDLRALPDRIADGSLRERVARARADRPLEPLFDLAVRRTRRLLEEDGNRVAFVLDVGEMRAGERRAPFHEVGLELLEGEQRYLHRLALELQEEIPLRLRSHSLQERGQALATGERPGPRRAGRLELETDAHVDDLLAALIRSGLRQVLENEVPAREGLDPEGVHQLRVGVRRLRATLALFGRMLPEHESSLLKTELRWLGGSLGPARDLDVFVEELLEPVVLRFPDVPGLKRLRDEARELREEGYGRVRAALDSPRYARLGLILNRWWAERAWRDQPLSPEAARLFAPAAGEVALLLGRRHRRALRLGRGVARRSVAEKHVLRIQLKKLRYAADAARSLFPRRRAERYVERLADLQDVLGHLNDVAAAELILGRILARLGSEAGPSHHHAAGFVAGWAAHGAERRLRRLGRLWKTFAASKPFWVE